MRDEGRQGGCLIRDLRICFCVSWGRFVVYLPLLRSLAGNESPDFNLFSPFTRVMGVRFRIYIVNHRSLLLSR